MTYKAMYKYELASAAGVSTDTFRRWLISDHLRFDAALAQGLILTLTDPLAAAAEEPARDYDIFIERD